MRTAQLNQRISEMVTDLFDEDVADAITECQVFDVLVAVLDRDTGGDEDAMRQLLNRVAEEINDTDTADWLVEDADKPAAFIISRTR